MRTRTLARTVGRGIRELPGSQAKPGVSSAIGWPHPRKGGTGAEGETNPGGEGEGPESQTPHPVQDGWNSWSGSLGPPWQWRLLQRDWGGGM